MPFHDSWKNRASAGLPTPPKPLTDRSPCLACFWTVACNACGVGRPADTAELFHKS